ncbi:hypothetical protein Pint_35327 [Pistacia integerrima]|uniref:Uncharacterized protein n=1 Tax=Pistacia integerrima TaxID=434235 RepID=A0ACC0Y1M9_9ROSI|nr:hypothetical protein Pint_35327 [Pistacia integerrima]
MACSINITLRCSTDTPRFGDTCHLQFQSPNPRSPLLLKLFPSSISHHPKKISYSCTRRRSFVTVKSHMATEEKPISEDRMLVCSLYTTVFVPPHPLIKHWVSVLRNEQTPCPIFRNAMAELGRLLIYEASRDWLPTVTGEIQSPMGVASVEFVDPREPVAVVPILRAGLALAEHATSILPATKTFHLGISRDEETLQPTIYLNKLPEKFPEGSRVFVVDPMLATVEKCMTVSEQKLSLDLMLPFQTGYQLLLTSGTIVASVNLLKERGVENKQIRVISAVAAPPALQKLSEKFPGLHVYTGIIDPTVNDKGFIVPGLGDAGDRSFGT